MNNNEIMDIILKKYVPEIYDEQSACLLIFRSLPQFEKQFLMRLLYIDNSDTDIKKKDILDKIVWYDRIAMKMPSNLMKDACVLLYNNKIILITEDKEYIYLHKNFKENLKKISENGINLEKVKINVSKKKNCYKSYLDCYKHGKDQSEAFLIQILNIKDQERLEDDNENIKFLKKIKFIEFDQNKHHQLSSLAINTILSDKQSQIRKLVANYISINEYESRNVDFIKFLFLLCTLNVGVPYSCSGEYFTESNLKHLEFFRNFGIIWMKRRRKRFYVTPFIKYLFENIVNVIDTSEDRYLTIESNFKIYAYTDNKFNIQILDFLCDIEYVFPQFRVGSITRSSIRRVMKRGADSQIILRFLSNHAHKQMDYKTIYNDEVYNIPENVLQQILIWEEEKNAIIAKKSLYLSDFASSDQFNRFMKFVKTDNLKKLWSNDSTNEVVILYENEAKLELVKKRIKELEN